MFPGNTFVYSPNKNVQVDKPIPQLIELMLRRGRMTWADETKEQSQFSDLKKVVPWHIYAINRIRVLVDHATIVSYALIQNLALERKVEMKIRIFNILTFAHPKQKIWDLGIETLRTILTCFP